MFAAKPKYGKGLVYLETVQKKTVWQTVRESVLPFLESVKNGPDILFFILAALYIASQFLRRIAWTYADYLIIYKTCCFIVGMGSGAYLVYKALACKALWKKPVMLTLMLAVFVGLTLLLLWNLSSEFELEDIRQSVKNASYVLVMDIFFCLMAYGKNYKNLLKCLLFIPILTLLIAGLGLLMGFTVDSGKPSQEEMTRSLGIIYPNTWGYIAFQALLIAWYLYFKKHALVTVIIFWATAAFMYFVVGCRTITALAVVFPLVGKLVIWTEDRAKQREQKKRPGIIGWIAVGLPVLCYVFTIVLSFQMEMMQKLYSTPLASMAMRFVQGGIALDEYGFPLIGHPMKAGITRILNGYTETLSIMDNAYSSFTILKGMIWMVCCLFWLTAAQWNGWKNRDYGIMLIGGFMLFFALMEHPGLELWYNFVLFLPLASLAEKPLFNTAPKPSAAVKKNIPHKKRKRR